MTGDLKSILAFMMGASAMSPDGGYGGIDMCITCKKNSRDKYKDRISRSLSNYLTLVPEDLFSILVPEPRVQLLRIYRLAL